MDIVELLMTYLTVLLVINVVMDLFLLLSRDATGPWMTRLCFWCLGLLALYLLKKERAEREL